MVEYLSGFKLIITGNIGVGKSTVVQKFIKQLSIDCAGFKTEKIVEEDRIVGYRLTEIGGKSETFAHINFPKKISLHDYGVDFSVFRNFGRDILCRSLDSNKVILMDELGIVEEKEPLFCNKVKDIFLSNYVVLAVVQKRALDFWLGDFNGVDVFEVTLENRGSIVEKLLRYRESFVKRET